MWETRLGNLRLAVQHRSQDGDGGATLRVLDANGDERLRFDCFERRPHFHLDPAGRDEISALDPRQDTIAWTLGELRGDLRGYLDRTDAPGAEFDDDGVQAALDAAEAALRNPPLDLDALDLADLRARISEKWSTYDEDVLAAWVAEMDFPIAEPIRRVLQGALSIGDIGYPLAPSETGLPEIFADRMARRFGWEPDPANTEILQCVVQGLHVALDAYSERGSGVVVQTPIYPPFLNVVSETGRRLVDNRLLPGPERFEIDFDRLAKDADPDTRVLLFCNPHNPTGRVFDRAELQRIAELACARDWVVVSDEIHADLVYENREFIPFASLGPEVAARTVTLTSATKAFNIPGLRCGVAHFGSADLKNRFNAAHPRNARGGVGLLGLYASQAAWQHSQPWLDTVLDYLDENRRFLAERLAKDFPEIRFRLPEATYLAWLDCRELGLGPAPSDVFLERGRVALNDGRHFGAGLEGHARLNFATSKNILGQILDRMKNAIETA